MHFPKPALTRTPHLPPTPCIYLIRRHSGICHADLLAELMSFIYEYIFRDVKSIKIDAFVLETHRNHDALMACDKIGAEALPLFRQPAPMSIDIKIYNLDFRHTITIMEALSVYKVDIVNKAGSLHIDMMIEDDRKVLGEVMI